MAEKGFIISLIENIQKHPCLWDSRSITYGKRDQLEEAWREVSKSCGKPVLFCRDKWRNVRLGFLRSVTNSRQKNLTAAGKKRPFYLYNHMEFLLPIVTRTEPQLDTSCHSSNEDSEFIKLEESSTSDTLSLADLERYGNGLESEKSDGLYVNLDTGNTNLNANSQFEKQMDSEESLTKSRKLTSDADAFRATKDEQTLMSFFKGIVSDVAALPSHRQRLFKRKIVELIDDLHQDTENMQAILRRESGIVNSGH